MLDDYKIDGPKQKLDVEIEKDVSDKLQLMVQYTKLSPSEITNTALKRFIITHKDFLPPANRG
ncbi:MAG: hypothetical protein AB7P04_01425 [Bacteriovoracia bacterium]